MKPTPAPWYLPQHDEIALFEAAHRVRQPVLLKGPTGCGKTRFVEHMAWRLMGPPTALAGRSPQGGAIPTGGPGSGSWAPAALAGRSPQGGAIPTGGPGSGSWPPAALASRSGSGPERVPLVTVACHDDLSASDLVGRYLLDGERTVWVDGPLTRAARQGSICYLDEIVEARKDTTVVLHALTDHRRLLPIDKTGELLAAHADFQLVVSYNPGYQAALKDLKPSTRQRFVCLEFDYPGVEAEAEIIAHESGVDPGLAERLAVIASRVRRLDEPGLELGVGTRLLVYAAQLAAGGIAPRRALDVALVSALSDEAAVQRAIADVVDLVLPQ